MVDMLWISHTLFGDRLNGDTHTLYEAPLAHASQAPSTTCQSLVKPLKRQMSLDSSENRLKL